MDTETEISVKIASNVTGEFIRDLRSSLGESLSEFGWRLARAIDPKARYPYTRQYISALEHGKFKITPQLEAALWNIAAAQDDVPAGIGGAIHVKVLAQPGQIPEGTMISRTMVAKKCANPFCSVVFVGSAKYHDPDCRKWYSSYRRRQK